MSNSVWIIGHSLAAAEAAEYAFDRWMRKLLVSGVYLFASPQPGNAVLGAAATAIPVWRSIQNRSGPHFPNYDLVTSVPFEAGPLLDYSQPSPFELINEPPLANDPWGLFRYHHFELYQAGAHKMPKTGALVELADAADAVADLYNGVGQWDVKNFVDGQYWGARKLPNGALLLVFRGSKTATDWIHDFDFRQIVLHGARISAGFWKGPQASLDLLDKALM